MDDKKPLELDLASIGQNLNRNLSALMENNRISLTILHRNTNIAIPTIKRLQSDPTTNPTITTLLPIANFFGITIAQLIGNEQIPIENTGYIADKTHWLKVPIIEWDQVLRQQEKQYEFTSFILVDSDVGQHPFALKVEEEDWVAISKGSILIINPDIAPEHRDYAIVHKLGQNNPTLKQILIDEEKTYLKSMNSYFPPTLLDESHQILGVLIQIRKDTKV